MPAHISFFRQNNGKSHLFSVAFGVLFAAALLLTAQGVSAATITVDSLGNTGGAGCELREAITSANNDSAGATGCTAGSGTDTIVFSTSGVINISGGSGNLPNVTSAIIVDGGNNITISAANTASRRIFNITSAVSVTLQNIVLFDGNEADGGCIANAGGTQLTLTNVVIDDCASTGDGGAIYQGDGTGSIIMTDVTFSDNYADGGEGGAIHAGNGITVTANNVTAVRNRTSLAGSGGVIYYNNYDDNVSAVTINGGMYSNNTSTYGGAIYIRFNDNHVIDGATFTQNWGGVAEEGDAGNGGAIMIDGGAEVLIADSTFLENRSVLWGSGGALEVFDGDVTIEDTHFEGNIGPYGGAIHMADGEMNIDRTTFLDNVAEDEGGAAYFSDNGAGGGTILVTNSHFEGNIAESDGGGAIRNRRGILTLYNNTFFNNTTPGSGGAFLMGDPDTESTTYANNIFEGNEDGSGDTCAIADASAVVASQGNNLFDDATNCEAEVSDIIAPTADLGPLALNGGLTLNRLPNEESPAVDAASATYAPAVDQRNVARPQLLADDIGSTELDQDSTPPVLAEVTRVPTSTNDTTPNYTFSSTEVGSIVYGGSCSSATTSTTVGSNTVTFNTLGEGTYSDCTITVSDSAYNTSTALTVSTFTVDTTAPTLAEVTRVPAWTNDTTPNYTFSSTEAGTITYGGSCSSATTVASSGSNTVTFNTLTDGTYSDCTITVSDSAFNTSTQLSVFTFRVDTVAPILEEVTPVPTTTRDTTPNYTFASTQGGALTYGGSCSSAATSTEGGTTTITLNALAEGTYSDCTIQVSDLAFNTSTALTLSSFTIDTTSSTLAEVTPVPTPTNDQTPNYTFSSTEAGTIVYGGSCSSATAVASSGNNTVTFNSLGAGTYSDCTISVVDSAFNTSTALTVSTFTIDLTAPTLAEVTPVTTPTNDTTPGYAFSSNENGTASYGGSCSATTTAILSGTTAIAFNVLADGTYSNCTITVTDASGNASVALEVSDFTIDATGPVITILGSSSVDVTVGSDYTDAGATAMDAREGNLTADIVTVNSVNTTTIGVYTVTYDVSDSLGNAATQAVRTVNVIAEPPPSTGGSGGGGLGSSGSSALPPPNTTFQTSDPGRPQRLEVLQQLDVAVHGLIKLADDGNAETQDDAAVYYVGSDGRRHAFPNAAVYFTWYSDFSQVQTVSLTQLASIPLGSNVTYKPGVKMVKFMTDPKVYAVEKGGILRWITSEPVAILLYGPMWNMNIDDVNDAFFMNYRFGANINSLGDYSPATARASVAVPSDSLEL